MKPEHAFLPPTLFAAVVLLWTAVGCQQLKRDSVLEKLPPPPFRVFTAAPDQPAASPRSGPAPQLARAEPGWIPARASDRWQCIVIHHSATRTGNAAEFGLMHRNRGWDELGYHFVIGNGTGSGDGEVEVGPRWRKQKHGAHAKTPDNWYNEHGIGICLVGNFDLTRPSDRQMAALARLVSFLQGYFGLDPRRVYGHGDLKSTDCPGRFFSFGDLNARLQRYRVTPGRVATDTR
jgi:hypothetical protein